MADGGFGQDFGNPWANVDASSAGHAATMNKVMTPAPQFQAPPKGKVSIMTSLSPMRAIEKDPVLAGLTGNKWTPVDPALTGQRPQESSGNWTGNSGAWGFGDIGKGPDTNGTWVDPYAHNGNYQSR